MPTLYTIEQNGKKVAENIEYRCAVQYCIENKLMLLCGRHNGLKADVWFIRQKDGFRFRPGFKKLTTFVEVVR